MCKSNDRLYASNSPPDYAEFAPKNAFIKAMEELQSDDNNKPNFASIRELLKIAGFSQNGRNQILYLTCTEIENLCAQIPKSPMLWSAYVNEVNLLLSKMGQYRKLDSHMDRPCVTVKLVNAIGKLYCLRHLESESFEHIQAQSLRVFLVEHSKHEWFVGYIKQNQKSNKIAEGEPISIRSVIKFLELYRNELISPPRLQSVQTFSDIDMHELEVGGLGLMDDGGNLYLEAIRDFPVVTYYDELPRLDTVLDWFIVARPAMDKNQLKRGWLYIEKLSGEWQSQRGRYDYFEDIISTYPSWNCVVADRQEAWLTRFPLENSYKIYPLTTPQELLRESQVMNHCVVTYLGRCISGNTRTFSIRESENGHSVCTAELALNCDRWDLVQLKGKYNQEMMHRTLVSNDPLAIALDILVKWHNENFQHLDKF
jgi:hypothetical protein